MSSSTIHIQIFGQLQEIIGGTNLELPHAASVAELKQALEISFPLLAGRAYAIAINKKIQAENVPIQPGAAIALLPPFSGG